VDPVILEHLLAAGLGALGGLGRALMATDCTLKQGVTDVILGLIAGFVFKFSGAPNHFGTFFAGYSGAHFLSKGYEKIKDQLE